MKYMPVTNPWLITATLMIGTLAAVMGSSTINTALPDIMSGLSIAPTQISWVSTAYMLANVIAIPSAAWLGNLLSKRILFGVGMATFLVGSILCGLAGSFEMLIMFRVLQGLGAGLVMPTAQSMLFESFPPDKRGMAMGIYGMGAIMGPAIGPTVGGYLVSLFSWRAVFFINIPFGLTSLALLGTLPRAPRRTGLAFDAVGFAAMVLFLVTLQIAITNGSKDGWDADYIIFCMVTAALGFCFLLYHELTTPAPLLDLRVFRFPIYTLASIVSMIVGLGLFGATFLVPIFLGNLLNYSALQIGLLLLPGSLAMGVCMLVAGRLSDLIDARLLLFAGLGLFGVGVYMQAQADITSPDALHMWANVWRGVGIGLCFSPLSAICMRGMPPSMIAQATGIFNLTRQLAGSIGIAALNTILISRTTFHGALLGQSMARSALGTQSFVGAMRGGLMAHGLSARLADQAAFSMLMQAARQQVAVLSYADLFYLCLVIVMIGFLPIPFMGTRPAK
jgi:DHA2 family multidrug resistance protein